MKMEDESEDKEKREDKKNGRGEEAAESIHKFCSSSAHPTICDRISNRTKQYSKSVKCTVLINAILVDIFYPYASSEQRTYRTTL
jgi:hypothetical protein